MLTAACVGTNDLKAAAAFYDEVLGTIKMQRTAENAVEIGYGAEGWGTSFWVLKPYNKEPATFGNGSQVMFRAEDQAAVEAFYDTAMSLGGQDEGKPGPRDYAEGYFGAYVRDPDGNKLHIFHRPE